MTRPPLELTVDLLPRPGLDPDEPAGGLADDVAIVIDVLRMTTTATVLAELGLTRLDVVADVQRARERARKSGALLLGERDARPLPGFDGGNSPLEFTGVAVLGRSAVLCTSNGSAAVEACAGAAHVLLGSLRNARAVALRALALAHGRIRVVCAGTGGVVSLDDVVAAGRIVAALAELAPEAALADTALLARAAGDGAIGPLLANCRHGRALARAGFADDIAEAARIDVTERVLERLPGSTTAFACRGEDADVE